MTTTIDHGPAARRLAGLLAAIPDSALTMPTPCADMNLAALLDHVHGLSIAFAQAATKDLPEGGSRPPTVDAARLVSDWRARIPELLDELAAAWRAPEAWEGMTEAGGVKLPGEIAGNVALNEIVVHGWDVARATGQPYEAGADEVEACLAFVGPSVEESGGTGVDGLFGPAVRVPDGAAPLDRLIAMTGRDPAWTPAPGSPVQRTPAP
ncbi:TIGR03086 family protein [Actinomadura sp. CNU-125]|uniref:TIGR03086 family metal-binding protein n=1 Tax=Actinomadura sp. CNU-125 TaxID=1904961 RepID=UPI000966F94F|nr:TIGR03086 family metal-binding protein [Actinomadura sp. CNU-125]OLT14174.1 TIGR03086 family protein [Actinomadura sp. CNU-125]